MKPHNYENVRQNEGGDAVIPISMLIYTYAALDIKIT